MCTSFSGIRRANSIVSLENPVRRRIVRTLGVRVIDETIYVFAATGSRLP